MCCTTERQLTIPNNDQQYAPHCCPSPSWSPLSLQRQWKTWSVQRRLLSRSCWSFPCSTPVGWRWTWGENSWKSLGIKNFLGFYDCLFLLLHSQQSQGRHVLVKGLKIMTLLSLVKNQHLRCARTILTSGCGWGTTPIMTAPIWTSKGRSESSNTTSNFSVFKKHQCNVGRIQIYTKVDPTVNVSMQNSSKVQRGARRGQLPIPRTRQGGSKVWNQHPWSKVKRNHDQKCKGNKFSSLSDKNQGLGQSHKPIKVFIESAL